MKIFLALAVGAALLLGAAACGDDDDDGGNQDINVTIPSDQQTSGINVAGEGIVAVEPDVAEISFGVEVTEDNADLALVNVNGAMENVLAVLEDAGVEEEDIQTTGITIYPTYDFESSTPEITGFTASNQVDVKVRDLEQVGPVIDGVTNAAGNAVRINYIVFEREDQTEALAQARELAVQDAQARAEALADGSGVELGEIISITETSVAEPPPVPFFEGGADERAAQAEELAQTAVNPGTLDVQVTVFVVYALSE
jgi:uncharacterized protein